MARWPAGIAVLVIVLATAAGSMPSSGGAASDDVALRDVTVDGVAVAGEPLDDACRKALAELAERYRDTPNISTGVRCEDPGGVVTPTRPVSAPTPADCVSGPARPVFGTALATVTATAAPGEAIAYEYETLNGGDTTGASGSPGLEFGPGDLAPGATYRWRARIDTIDSADAWSRWCEFTVSPAAVDYRQLGDVSLEALNELGLRPDRSYTITLSASQQRLLRAGTDVGGTSTRMTLTGPRWTDLLLQLTESAVVADEVAADSDPPAADGTAYRELVDALSAKLS
ncbi:hypothetical protein ACQP2X_11380 [Actinoplanes sp. CA-131856]